MLLNSVAKSIQTASGVDAVRSAMFRMNHADVSISAKMLNSFGGFLDSSDRYLLSP